MAGFTARRLTAPCSIFAASSMACQIALLGLPGDKLACLGDHCGPGAGPQPQQHVQRKETIAIKLILCDVMTYCRIAMHKCYCLPAFPGSQGSATILRQTRSPKCRGLCSSYDETASVQKVLQAVEAMLSAWFANCSMQAFKPICRPPIPGLTSSGQFGTSRSLI